MDKIKKSLRRIEQMDFFDVLDIKQDKKKTSVSPFVTTEKSLEKEMGGEGGEEKSKTVLGIKIKRDF